MSQISSEEKVFSSLSSKDSELSRTGKCMYSSGEIASNLTWNMVNAFLLYYYTDIAQIPAAPLVWLFLCTKIIDAFVDIGVGRMVDHTRSRWGHARPYILYGAIPFGIISSLLFMVPEFSISGKIIYAFITYGVFSLCYSLIYVPYTALQALITNNPNDHAIIGGLRSASTSIASVIVFYSTQKLVTLVGGGAFGWGAAAVIFSLGSIALYLLVFFGTKERVQTQRIPPANIAGTIKRMFHNPIWLSSFILLLVNMGRVITLVSVLPYMTKILLHDTSLLGIFLTLQSIIILVGSFMAGPLMNRFSVFSVNVVSVIVGILMFCILPFVEGNIPFMLVLFAVASLPISMFNTTIFTGCSNAANVQERMYGTRDEGMLASGISFSYKLGGAIGVAIVALFLSEAKYNPTEVTQEVAHAVRLCFYWLQIGFLLLHIPSIVMLRRVSAKPVEKM
ncbi:MFS transporter [Klebsiella oxytoca]|uniref:MFS transporter n=1 Tax=Klebsiella oxytoca TaxID=571 RepID=UPI00357153B4